jgi:hypothetical protein
MRHAFGWTQRGKPACGTVLHGSHQFWERAGILAKAFPRCAALRDYICLTILTSESRSSAGRRYIAKLPPRGAPRRAQHDPSMAAIQSGPDLPNERALRQNFATSRHLAIMSPACVLNAIADPFRTHSHGPIDG